jgi:hypothetical protein
MSSKRDKLVNQLSNDEMSEFGFGDNQLDDLHAELGIVEEEETVEEVMEEEEEVVDEEVKKPAKKTTPRKRTTPAKKTQQKKQQSARDLLKNIKIDLNNIEFSDKSPLEKIDDIEFILNGKPSFQVVANQSGYIAHMESIRLADINSITNSTMDMYASKQKLYKTIFSKINTTSIGKMDYKTWLRVTSFFDLPSLMYGIYNQTFPGDTTFEVTCRHCQQPTDVIVNNETLIDVKDEATYSKLAEIVNHAKKPEDLLKDSLVNKYTRSVLPDDKILVDIQTPSLWNHLELLASIDKRQLEELDDVIGTMLFIKNLYVLDISALKQGKVKYSEVTDKNQIVNILRNLEVNDAKALGDAISDRTEKYAIYYKIKDHNCSKCGNSVGEIPVDMETMLFTQILQM